MSEIMREIDFPSMTFSYDVHNNLELITLGGERQFVRKDSIGRNAEHAKLHYEQRREKCRDEGDEKDFICSACGMHLFKMYASDSYTMVEKDMMTIIRKPLFCPWCGREVER